MFRALFARLFRKTIAPPPVNVAPESTNSSLLC